MRRNCCEDRKPPIASKRAVRARTEGGSAVGWTAGMGRKGLGVKALANCRLIGRWRIVEADLRDRAYLNFCGPATLTITAQGGGSPSAPLETGLALDSIGFRWTGCDEGDQVEGEGTAELLEDGSVEIEFAAENSFLVPCKEVFVKTPDGPFQPGSVWGEPDIHVAADFTRKAAESPSLFFQVGERGRYAVIGKLSAEAVGPRLRDLCRARPRAGVAPRRRRRHGQSIQPQGAESASPRARS